MKKIFLLALGAMMSINAWSYENVPATFVWTVGNEAGATVFSDAVDGVKETKVVLGAGITVAGTKSNYDANNGNEMVQYQPAESNKGVDASVMIEFRVKMKKGVTFALTGISYDALKDGTDNASYHWSYAVDGVESDVTAVSKDDLVRNNNTSGTPALNHSHAVTATAGQVVAFRIYVSGFGDTKKLALGNIKLTGTVNGEAEVRAFTDFKIDFRSKEPTIVEPATLPSNVLLTDLIYKDSQHGLQGGTITVVVDGPVKFTLGGCTYGNIIAVKKNGVDLTTIDNKVGCDNSGVGNGYTKFATWTYNVEEAATLSFTVNGYLPYFFAEACEFVPQVEVRYFDVDGKTLIGEPQIVDGGSALKFAYGASDVTVAEGKAFRGWFNASAPTATKVAEGTPLTENLNLYAKATDIEVAALGKVYTYDLTKNYFYQEDHELFSAVGGHAHSDISHGWVFGNGNTLSIQVAGNALLSVSVCTYSNTGTTVVKDAAGNTVGQLDVEKNVTTEGSEQVIRYTGDATTLTFEFTTTNYIHAIKVYNIAEFPEKNEMGYFEVAPGDAAGFLLALTAAEAGDKIFLPRGTYDLGEAVLTPISKNNISIIGESMEETIIKNAPDFHNEGISTTAIFLITAENTYLQDLTLWNNLDYFAAIKAGLGGGRAVCLQDKGTKTVCKNVRMLSNQDTYYSNKVGAVRYFEDCEIHGTVDFICGDGSVYFKNNVLVGEQRNPDGGGANAITASNADASDKGYVFEGCRVMYAENIEGTKPVMSLGRSWNNAPKTIFLNTILDNTNGDLIMEKDANAQKDKIQRWTLGAMNALPEKFGEFNSVDKDGNVVSPASNNVTFILGTNEKPMETILSANEAATYTMEYTLGEWAPTAKADATQIRKNVFFENSVLSWNPSEVGIYLVYIHSLPYCITTETSIDVSKVDWKELYEKYGWGNLMPTADYYVRFANARGGFGPAIRYWDNPEAIENTAAEAVKAQKIFRDGQVLIVRDGKEYTILGNELVK